MTKKVCLSLAAVAAIGLLAVPARGDGARGGKSLRADLKAKNEVPTVVSAATGTFRGEVAEDGLSFTYVLNYEGFEGTVTQSHIHIAQRFASGGISVWLCQTATNPAPAAVAAQTPMCGAPGGDGDEAMGTISAEDVIGPTGQAVPATAFADLMAAIRSGNAYANVHSTSAPGGEVRGQIMAGKGNDGGDRDDHDHR
jgi:CHRD domain-containing protein